MKNKASAGYCILLCNHGVMSHRRWSARVFAAVCPASVMAFRVYDVIIAVKYRGLACFSGRL